MAAPTIKHEPVSVQPMDPKEIADLLKLLHRSPQPVGHTNVDVPKLVGSTGDEMPLPESIYRLLCDILPYLRRGEALVLMPEQLSLTTQEAADILGMSRPYLKKLLDADTIPYYRVGTHRRLKLADVTAYKERRESERQRQMEEFVSLSEEMGVYQ